MFILELLPFTKDLNLVFLVHILSGDLILHKRTLEPIKTLVYGLRRYDVDRSEALIDFSDPANKDVKAVGFMSHTSKIYLVGPVFAVFHKYKLTVQR
jgi:hypothetical protein